MQSLESSQSTVNHPVLGVFGSFGTDGHIFGREKNYIQSVEKLESAKNSPGKHKPHLSAKDNHIELEVDPDQDEDGIQLKSRGEKVTIMDFNFLNSPTGDVSDPAIRGRSFDKYPGEFGTSNQADFDFSEKPKSAVKREDSSAPLAGG